MTKRATFIQAITSTYTDLKQTYREAIFFFRENGMITIIHEDARVSANILGILAESENGTNYLQFPAEQSDEYLAAIVRSGNRVAIVEPIS